MIFIANVLALNGGTTFLIRTCTALAERGHRCAVIVLRKGGESALETELSKHATILSLEHYQRDRGRVLRRHLGAFAPISWMRLAHDLAPFGSTLHAMGVFGLIFGARLSARRPGFRLTVGVYHQNEFIFRERPVFSRQVRRLFREMPPENILFFNEVSRDNYHLFHGIDYEARSPLAPIGIVIPRGPAHQPVSARSSGRRIVSIGSLERFKTYNRHVIELLPRLTALFSGIHYDIHGGGTLLATLQDRAKQLGVADAVTFHGPMDYEAFDDVVRAADVFVGSGTALIEAAALGRPAVIGIESTDSADTYGFLSDIRDLSYNEAGAGLPMRPIMECLVEVLADDDRWQQVAAACRDKASEFSVERTADAFMALARDARPTDAIMNARRSMRMLAELPLLTLWDRITPRFAFAERRNQSFQR